MTNSVLCVRKGDQLGAGRQSAIGRICRGCHGVAGWLWRTGSASTSRIALTLVELAENDTRRQQMSAPGVFCQKKRASGFEPPTSSLGSWHSTTELRPQVSNVWRRSRQVGTSLRGCRHRRSYDTHCGGVVQYFGCIHCTGGQTRSGGVHMLSAPSLLFSPDTFTGLEDDDFFWLIRIEST